MSDAQLSYFKARLKALSARLFVADRLTSGLRHELEQRRRSFSLLAQLSAELLPGDAEAAFMQVAQKLNSVLNMQRTLVLQAEPSGLFRVLLSCGFNEEQSQQLRTLSIALPAELQRGHQALLLNSAVQNEALRVFARSLHLPYFVACALLDERAGQTLILTGRIKEQAPFLPQLDLGDQESLLAICGLLSAVFTRQRLLQISHQANHDALTGLPNLRLGMERLRQALQLAQHSGRELALLFIDLDGFKAINDSLGHEAGDEVLCLVAGRLKAVVRNSDSDSVARIGGDEFILIMPELSDAALPERVAQRILSSLAEPVFIKSQQPYLGASIGIVTGGAGQSVEQLLAAADEAMYAVKRSGKNAYRVVRVMGNESI